MQNDFVRTHINKNLCNVCREIIVVVLEVPNEWYNERYQTFANISYDLVSKKS